MFHFLFYHIRSSFANSYKTEKLRQRPTLPGDIVPLFRPQGAGADILTKYVLRSVKDDLEEERCR